MDIFFSLSHHVLTEKVSCEPNVLNVCLQGLISYFNFFIVKKLGKVESKIYGDLRRCSNNIDFLGSERIDIHRSQAHSAGNVSFIIHELMEKMTSVGSDRGFNNVP